MDETITTKIEEPIGFLIINRPEAMNALNEKMLLHLEQQFKLLEDNPQIYVIILTGTGKSFIGGFDITEELSFTEEEAAEGSARGKLIFNLIEQCEKPVIAAINGYALGGGLEMALCCDIRISGDKAKFGLPEVRLGVIPGFGGTQRLPRLIGEGWAKKLIFTGDTIHANKAQEIGLVEEVYPQAELMDKVILLAKKICLNGELAVRNAKKAINFGIRANLKEGLKQESQLFGNCYTSAEQKTRMKSFLRKNRRKKHT